MGVRWGGGSRESRGKADAAFQAKVMAVRIKVEMVIDRWILGVF